MLYWLTVCIVMEEKLIEAGTWEMLDPLHLQSRIHVECLFWAHAPTSCPKAVSQVILSFIKLTAEITISLGKEVSLSQHRKLFRAVLMVTCLLLGGLSLPDRAPLFMHFCVLLIVHGCCTTMAPVSCCLPAPQVFGATIWVTWMEGILFYPCWKCFCNM